jgi:hypothetical protein
MTSLLKVRNLFSTLAVCKVTSGIPDEFERKMFCFFPVRRFHTQFFRLVSIVHTLWLSSDPFYHVSAHARYELENSRKRT